MTNTTVIVVALLAELSNLSLLTALYMQLYLQDCVTHRNWDFVRPLMRRV